MKKLSYLLIGAALITAVLFIAGCKKRGGNTQEPDGTVKDHSDPTAPTATVSSDIVSFSCTFSTLAVDELQEISGKVFRLDAVANGTETEVKYSWHDRNGNGNSGAFITDLRFMRALQNTVARHGLTKHNGHSHTVSGLPDNYGAELSILYASGEKIYADDNQDNFLSSDAMRELASLFGISSVSGSAGWQRLSISRTHSVWSCCFNMSVTAESDGSMLLRGYCVDTDGNEYSSDDGISVSEKTISRLRQLELEDLEKAKKNSFPGPTALDKAEKKLILTDIDGKKTEKVLTDDTLSEIFDLLLSEFKNEENLK